MVHGHVGHDREDGVTPNAGMIRLIKVSRPLTTDNGGELTVEIRGKWSRHQIAGKEAARGHANQHADYVHQESLHLDGQ